MKRIGSKLSGAATITDCSRLRDLWIRRTSSGVPRASAAKGGRSAGTADCADETAPANDFSCTNSRVRIRLRRLMQVISHINYDLRGVPLFV